MLTESSGCGIRRDNFYRWRAWCRVAGVGSKRWLPLARRARLRGLMGGDVLLATMLRGVDAAGVNDIRSIEPLGSHLGSTELAEVNASFTRRLSDRGKCTRVEGSIAGRRGPHPRCACPLPGYRERGKRGKRDHSASVLRRGALASNVFREYRGSGSHLGSTEIRRGQRVLHAGA